jgi:hypothetical protein
MLIDINEQCQEPYILFAKKYWEPDGSQYFVYFGYTVKAR